MPNPKRIIPVSEVKPGHSITLPGVQGVLIVVDRWSATVPDEQTYIEKPEMVVAGAAFVALLGSVALLFGLYAACMAVLVTE